MKKLIYYLPRALAILIVAFLSIFILEGFGPEFGWQDSLMHLLVALVALGATIVAWKWPKVGGWFFVLFGLKFLLPMAIYAQPWSGLIIGGVPLLTGILFLVEGFRKNKKEKNLPPKNYKIMNKPNKDQILVAISVVMLLFTALINWTVYSWLILTSVIIILFVWYSRKT